jgi:hypothetical protein
MKCVAKRNPRKKIIIKSGEKKPQIGQKAMIRVMKHTTPRKVAVGIMRGQ